RNRQRRQAIAKRGKKIPQAKSFVGLGEQTYRDRSSAPPGPLVAPSQNPLLYWGRLALDTLDIKAHRLDRRLRLESASDAFLKVAGGAHHLSRRNEADWIAVFVQRA